MKLITHNIEGVLHLEKVEQFIRSEDADVLCLQEVPEEWLPTLNAIGYHVSFAYRCLRTDQTRIFRDGVVIATKTPHHADTLYYFVTEGEPDDSFDPATDDRRNNHGPLLHVSFPSEQSTFHLATTHFTWAPDGSIASSSQKQDLDALLAMSATLPPHILCGDFNIPRHHNELYAVLTQHYTDAIPSNYKSSLDKTFHRKGNHPAHAHLFTDYMVDYVFSQPPYQVSAVRLEFGLSDHAAVVTEISI